MSTSLFLLLILLAFVLLWLDGARARELAFGVANELCARRGLQLLDGTVGLSRLGLTRTESGIRIKRLFRFDYSAEGLGRQQSHILLHGSQVVMVDLPEPHPNLVPKPEASANPAALQPATKKGDDNVVPFRRRH